MNEEEWFLLLTCAICNLYVLLLWWHERTSSRRRRLAKMQQDRPHRYCLFSQSMRKPRVYRSVWKKERSKSFWNIDVPKFTDYDWIKNFRMRKETFETIVELVKDDMSPVPNSPNEPIPVRMRVAMAIYSLASSAEYRGVANTFGVGLSTVEKFVTMFCHAICGKLSQFIHPPSLQEAKDIAARIQTKYGFPQVFGCIDGSHVLVTAPTHGKRDFQNRKGTQSLVLQAIVDDKYCFWDINVTMPGSCHDAFVFTNSRVYENYRKLPKAPVEINGTIVPLLILGDPAYPLLPWLMKPYIGSNIGIEKDSFNTYLSSVRTMVENTFGRLKARWHTIGGKIESRIDYAPKLIATCCVLHNCCERSNTPIIDDWRSPASSDSGPHWRQGGRDASEGSSDATDAHIVRQALTEYVSANLPLRRSNRFS